MIYKDYFLNSEFEDVRNILREYYGEPESLMKLYKSLFYTIRKMTLDAFKSKKVIVLGIEYDGKFYIEGAPDPVEMLIYREVIIKEPVRTSKLSYSEICAHLLYWSTLYDFKTQMCQRKDMQKFLNHLELDDAQCGLEKTEIELSRKRKRIYYWKNAIVKDSAIDWSYILDILRMRIEFHIGFHKLKDRFVNSKFYVSRMELCCRLLNLVAQDSYTQSFYTNTRNAGRFVGGILSKYEYKKIKSGLSDDYLLTTLRRAKAYKVLWKFIDHNLTYWWD